MSKHLTLQERKDIELYLKEGKSFFWGFIEL